MLIFGSAALKHWIKDLQRVPSDIDILSQEPSTTPFFESHWCEGMEYIIANNVHNQYVDLDFLYTIKVSHCAWEGKNGKWVQHLKDINLMKEYGARLDYQLYDILYKEWESLFGKKRVNLNDSSTEFFKKDSVQRKYDHDKLHQCFKLHDDPLYMSILKDGSTVSCSKEKFNNLPYELQLEVAREEIAVITYERYYSGHYKSAKAKAFKNMVVSMTKGWFNIFLIENAVELMNNTEIDKFFETKMKGEI